ncbi:HAD hydrolase family protein [bacterium]|nr:HAD hydrolase family protein [bacterium]
MSKALNNEIDLPETVRRAAERVELIVMDVDGVLTDGHTYQLDGGEQFLCFDAQDGLALTLCRLVGMRLAVISGRDVPAARIRMGRFPQVELHMGVVQKSPVLRQMSESLGIPLENIAYIGDDLIDLPLLEIVGLPVSVPNAVPEARATALYVTRSAGGHGAVRELVTLVLKARGLYVRAVEQYLEEH